MVCTVVRDHAGECEFRGIMNTLEVVTLSGALWRIAFNSSTKTALGEHFGLSQAHSSFT